MFHTWTWTWNRSLSRILNFEWKYKWRKIIIMRIFNGFVVIIIIVQCCYTWVTFPFTLEKFPNNKSLLRKEKIIKKIIHSVTIKIVYQIRKIIWNIGSTIQRFFFQLVLISWMVTRSEATLNCRSRHSRIKLTHATWVVWEARP